MSIEIINGDCLEELKALPDNSIDSIVTDPPYGISFMGKKWDYDVPSIEVWQECLRVLKPGGHILCACGTRTQHRMAVNLEDAGFEIRDIVAWVYGSGFPKSMNIGKAVDKLQGNEREFVRQVKRTGKESGVLGAFVGNNIETKGNSPYEGWGTALKPAMELWTLARKPLAEKTIAANVLEFGTGGINIDGCRVGTETLSSQFDRDWKQDNSFGNGKRASRGKQVSDGRFPANIIHDGSDEVVSLFPETKPSVKSKECDNRSNKGNSIFINGVHTPENSYTDSGSAARFFYCAKASRKERNAGLDDMPDRLGGSLAGGNDTCNGKDVPQLRLTKNSHPTVKPIALMSYLCRLITPPNGTVLDPFMGSGSTGIGAKQEGFGFIGIELDNDYYDIAEVRIFNDGHKE